MIAQPLTQVGGAVDSRTVYVAFVGGNDIWGALIAFPIMGKRNLCQAGTLCVLGRHSSDPIRSHLAGRRCDANICEPRAIVQLAEGL